MIHDEDLKSSSDYSEGQKKAAHRVLVKHYIGGLDALARELKNVSDKPIIQEMKQKLQEKFMSEKHAGPKDVTNFMDLMDEDEIEMTKRDAYEQIHALLSKI